jgi:L-fuconolactonase
VTQGAVMESIDAHQHFWQLARGDYDWLTTDLAPIYRDFEPADLAPYLQRHGIAGTVLVQAAPTDAETEFLLDIAARTDFVRAVVGWCDFAAADAPDRIAALAARPKLAGLRPMIQDLPDDDWMLRPELAPAFQAVIAHGLVFDALVKPRHLAPLVKLQQRHPHLPIVVDHGAKPAIAHWKPGDAEFRRWREALAALAAGGAFCKFSGLVTEASPNWQEDDLAPYVAVLAELFGPERLVWGSDWPVVNLAGGYVRWREAAERLAAHYLPDGATAVFGGNAVRLYLSTVA